jgi:hypothetical protein
MHCRHAVMITLVMVGSAVTLAACGSAGPGVAGTGTSAAPNSKSSPIALSKCMRAHGVPNFPDPTAGPGGAGLQISQTPGSSALTVNGVTLSGPAFEAASKACKRLLPGGGGPPHPLSNQQKLRILAFARCMRAHGVPNFPDPTFRSGGGVLLQGVNPQAPAFGRASAACGRGGFGLRVGKP